MDEIQIYKLFSRLKQTPEGVDFIEYLEHMSNNTYKDFLSADSSKNDIFKGLGTAYNNLIQVFKLCDDKIKQLEVQPVDTSWAN